MGHVRAMHSSATLGVRRNAQQSGSCRTLHDELKAASSSATLGALTAVAAGQAIALLCQRVAALAAPPSDLRDLSGTASSAQLLNITLCSQLHEVQRALLALLPKLSPAAAEVLLPDPRGGCMRTHSAFVAHNAATVPMLFAPLTLSNAAGVKAQQCRQTIVS